MNLSLHIGGFAAEGQDTGRRWSASIPIMIACPSVSACLTFMLYNLWCVCMSYSAHSRLSRISTTHAAIRVLAMSLASNEAPLCFAGGDRAWRQLQVSFFRILQPSQIRRCRHTRQKCVIYSYTSSSAVQKQLTGVRFVFVPCGCPPSPRLQMGKRAAIS